MTAGQEVCTMVLNCISASRSVRLPPGSLETIIEAPPLDTQVLKSLSCISQDVASEVYSCDCILLPRLEVKHSRHAHPAV